jgi:hypothetical protein
LLDAGLEHGEWVRIENGRWMPIDGRVFVIELDMTGADIIVIRILMETEHEVPLRFDPVDPVVFVVHTGRIPEADFQPCVLNVIRLTQERCRYDICNHVPRSSSRRAVPNLFTPSLFRQSVANISEKGTLCIPVTSSEKDHDADETTVSS